jgi:hypothetical protein
MANEQSPKRTIIPVNGSAGAQVLVSATQSDGYVEITECPSEPYAGGAFVGQGLNYQRADENYATTYPLVPGAILQFGDAIRKNHSVGMIGFTYPDGSVRPATPFIKVISATVTATSVMLSEWRQGIC